MTFFWWLVIIAAGVWVLYMFLGRNPARVGGGDDRGAGRNDLGAGPGYRAGEPGVDAGIRGAAGDLPSPDTQFMREEHGDRGQAGPGDRGLAGPGDRGLAGPGGPGHAKVGEARETFPDRTGDTTALALGAERPPEGGLGRAAPGGGGGPADGFDSPFATIGATGVAERPPFGDAFGNAADTADAPGAGAGQFAAAPFGFDEDRTPVAPRQAAGADDPPRFPGAIGQDREPVTFGSPPAQSPGITAEARGEGGAHFTAVPPDTGRPAGDDPFPNRAPAGVEPHQLSALMYEQAGPANLPEEMSELADRLFGGGEPAPPAGADRTGADRAGADRAGADRAGES